MHAWVRLIKEFPILAFILASYLISWGVWIPMGVLGIDFNTQAGWLLYLIGSFGPSLAGLLLMGMLYGSTGYRWRRPGRFKNVKK